MPNVAILENTYSMGSISQGKAAKAFASVSTNHPAVIIKNNKPYRIVTTVDEYAYLTEIEEDLRLLEIALARLSASDISNTIDEEEVMAELGITEEMLDAVPDSEIAFE